MSETPLISIHDLSVTFDAGGAVVEAVKGVSFDIRKGETLALVGESGSGKTVTAHSVLQLLPYPVARHGPGSSIRMGEVEIVGADSETLRRIRGNRIALIPQEPMTSLNPLHTVERQVSEALFIHKGLGREAARTRALELLRLVRLDDAERRLGSYPHELSGG
ncbi:MAG: ATP-binding cassette domain-containing protein, partial [Alphaproteobacteria bacterium]